MSTITLRRMSLGLLPCLFATASLAAQTANCGVRSTYQMGNMAGGSNILQVDTGWQLPVATTNAQNGGGVPGQSLYSVGWMQTWAEFGRLRIQGGGQAQNWNGNGTSLYVVPTSSDTPTVRFRDTFAVQSQGLPVGAPVQLRVRVRLAGVAQMSGLMPLVSYGAQIRVDTLSSGLGLGSVVAALDSTTGIATASVPTTVGATLFVEGRVNVSMQELGVLNGLPATASYGIDLEGLFEFQSMSAGAAIVPCSATAYPSLSASTQAVGTGCGAMPPVLSSSLPLLGSTVALATVGAPVQSPVFSAFAFGAPQNLHYGACTLRVDPAAAIVGFVGIADSQGRVTSSLMLPNVGSLAGLQLTGQMVMLATNGPFFGAAELSNGVALVLGL